MGLSVVVAIAAASRLPAKAPVWATSSRYCWNPWIVESGISYERFARALSTTPQIYSMCSYVLKDDSHKGALQHHGGMYHLLPSTPFFILLVFSGLIPAGCPLLVSWTLASCTLETDLLALEYVLLTSSHLAPVASFFCSFCSFDCSSTFFSWSIRRPFNNRLYLRSRPAATT